MHICLSMIRGTSVATVLFVSAISAQSPHAIPYKTELTRSFEYVGGEKTWSNHIPTEITTTFGELLRKDRYLRSLVCSGDSTDYGKVPFARVKPVCLQGKGAKMVVPMGYPTWSFEVLISPETGGLFEQAHMTEKIPRHFYDTTIKFITKFFLLPFEDYEIPVYSIEEARIFLPMWKQLFLADNKMDESYFDAHIRVMGTCVTEYDRDSVPCKYMNVAYVYYVDWARIELQDAFQITRGRHMLTDRIDTSEYVNSFREFEEILPKGSWNYLTKRITHVQSIDHIISQSQVVEIVDRASPLLGFDVNKDVRLSPRGELILRLWGTIDFEANRCLRGKISLLDGMLLDIAENACWSR